ncbi:hypothetical protein MLD38_025296 [Melastoma candidum]|uniref:Uncharacterized protein n=1 Tax=Melastoma candidum TaxID=119954 RepID=A0ACB9NUY1_9MYRT|nr:hypothetical protein MLD38_025296 [Melastoma candidum]
MVCGIPDEQIFSFLRYKLFSPSFLGLLLILHNTSRLPFLLFLTRGKMAAAVITTSTSHTLGLFSILSLVLLSGAWGDVFGINYGRVADNLPSPSQVAALLGSVNITMVKLYDANPNVLEAFSDTDVEFVIGLGNEYLENMTDLQMAQGWVQQHVLPYVDQTRIACIVVGNEVSNSNDTQLMTYLLPAMQTVYESLVELGLDKLVTVTTAYSLSILGNSYPPSMGSFRQDLGGYIQPLLNFHSMIGSPFFINAYPYFAYKDNPAQVPLKYVLFGPNNGTTDAYTDLHYDNMLYAQIDAVYSAIKQMGHTDISVTVSETGWPSKGDPDEAGANLENAQLYNGNLLQRIQERQGTPAHPDTPIDVYMFALFNEDLKPGPTSERNYGLFYPDGRAVYDIGLQGYLPEFISAAERRPLTNRLLLVTIVLNLGLVLHLIS